MPDSNSPQRRKKPTSNPKPGKSRADRDKQKIAHDLAEPLGQPTADLMSMDFNTTGAASELATDQNKRCRKCGNLCKNGKCTRCQYVEPVYSSIDKPLDEIKIQIVGFQRWFCETMSEGIPVSVLKYLIHVGIGMFSLFVCGYALTGFFGGFLGPVFGTLVLIALFVSLSLYVALVFKGHQFLRKPNAQLSWFQKPFWRITLGLSRKMKWEHYDSRRTDRSVTTNNDPDFGDVDFSMLEGLEKCEVLDLEGTQVTDKTILRFYTMKHLTCIVLRKTDVTSEAIFRYQQSFPKTWIWF